MDLNVYDVYNSTVEADKPFVDAIVTAISAQITESITNNVTYFVFDLIPFFVETEQVQKNRIIDRVLYEVRQSGFSIKAVGDRVTEDIFPYAAPGFNSMAFNVTAFEINLRVRNNQEYMKTWC